MTDVDFDSQIEGSDGEEEEVVVDQGKRFYYELKSGLTSLTIGSNAKIGEHAFGGAACLETVSLGENAEIGKMSFYNNSSLKEIDLSKAVSIGDYAFSGDVYYICLDDSMSVPAISTEGQYQYTYHAPMLERVEISTAAAIGEFAFAYCRQLTDVVLNDQITEIPQYAFAGCIALENIDLSKIVTVGEYAFNEDEKLKAVDLSSAETVGEYAFVFCDDLASVTFNANGTEIGEGSFSYCEKLATVENLGASKKIDGYAFAYTALTEADLTAAEELGDGVFLKEALTPFTVKMSQNLEKVGENPFAFCDLDLANAETGEQTYEITRDVFVKDGVLYHRGQGGLELITYAGGDKAEYVAEEGTVRVGSMAFAGADLEMVTMPNTLKAIGHKAFFACENLEMVVLNSFTAPTLEEEFDASYYNNLEHIPGTGDFGTYTDYEGNEVVIEPMEMIPFFMWNATGGMYSTAYYGANFVDYVGYVDEDITLVRPVNGKNYDSFIWQQYFSRTVSGPAAPDATTLAAIQAIAALGSKVSYEDRDEVAAARAAYDKIATLEQKALVTNLSDLISAEQRITALAPTEEPADPQATEPGTELEAGEGGSAAGWIIGLAAAAAAGAGGYFLLKGKKKKETTEE